MNSMPTPNQVEVGMGYRDIPVTTCQQRQPAFISIDYFKSFASQKALNPATKFALAGESTL